MILNSHHNIVTSKSFEAKSDDVRDLGQAALGAEMHLLQLGPPVERLPKPPAPPPMFDASEIPPPPIPDAATIASTASSSSSSRWGHRKQKRDHGGDWDAAGDTGSVTSISSRSSTQKRKWNDDEFDDAEWADRG